MRLAMSKGGASNSYNARESLQAWAVAELLECEKTQPQGSTWGRPASRDLWERGPYHRTAAAGSETNERAGRVVSMRMLAVLHVFSGFLDRD